MKKLITLVLLAIAIPSVFSQGTVNKPAGSLQNGDFETWYNVPISGTLNYDDIGAGPSDNWLATLNSLMAVPPTAGGPGPVTVFKTTDAHSGTYAARSVSAVFQVGPTAIFIPGMIGTAKMDMTGIRALLGRSCPDCKPLSFKGYYKFTPVSGDSCAAVILLSKWNTELRKRDTIGYGKMVQHSAVSEYTQFDIPINYYSTGHVDTMTLLTVSSAGFNVINFLGSVGQTGSTMFVDDLSLDYPAGVTQLLMPEVTVKTYPNPATDVLHLCLSSEVKNGTVEIYAAGGQLVGTYGISSLDNTVPVYSLSTGAYYFRLMSGKDLLNSGTFVVRR